MTHALRRALSANRLLAACGSLLTVTSETPKGACRASTAGTDASVEPIRESRLGHGAGLRQDRLRPRGAFVMWCVAPARAFRNRYRGPAPRAQFGRLCLASASGVSVAGLLRRTRRTECSARMAPPLLANRPGGRGRTSHEFGCARFGQSLRPARCRGPGAIRLRRGGLSAAPSAATRPFMRPTSRRT